MIVHFRGQSRELQNNVHKKHISLDYHSLQNPIFYQRACAPDRQHKGMFNRERFALMKKWHCTAQTLPAAGWSTKHKDVKQAIADGIIARYVNRFS